jgi:hypothetical protein
MAEADLIEVHGRMGAHKCVQTPSCRFFHDETIGDIPYALSRSRAAVAETPPCGGGAGGGAEAEAARVTVAPLCPGCGKACLPQCLMFDELYAKRAATNTTSTAAATTTTTTTAAAAAPLCQHSRLLHACS